MKQYQKNVYYSLTFSIILLITFSYQTTCNTIQTRKLYKLIKLTNSSSALCIDGSPAAYYISQTGDNKKIYLQFEGGGWCGQATYQSTLQSCYQRSFGFLGSSNSYQPRRYINQGFLSEKDENYFKDWRRVKIMYCDGAGHQGTRKQPIVYRDKKLYFRGYNNTVQILNDLENKIKIFSQATHVIVSGLSAGGLAVFSWANYVGEKVKNGKVWAIPDSGIFLDSFNFRQQDRHIYRQLLFNLMKISNEQIGTPNNECNQYYFNLRKNKDQIVNCMFAQNLHKFIKIPIFAVQSLADAWSLPNILGSFGCQRNCNDKRQEKIVQQYIFNTSKVLNQIALNPVNGYWACSTPNHVYVWSSYLTDIAKIPFDNKYSLGECVGRWINETQKNKLNKIRTNMNNVYSDNHEMIQTLQNAIKDNLLINQINQKNQQGNEKKKRKQQQENLNKQEGIDKTNSQSSQSINGNNQKNNKKTSSNQNSIQNNNSSQSLNVKNSVHQLKYTHQKSQIFLIFIFSIIILIIIVLIIICKSHKNSNPPQKKLIQNSNNKRISQTSSDSSLNQNQLSQLRSEDQEFSSQIMNQNIRKRKQKKKQQQDEGGKEIELNEEQD